MERNESLAKTKSKTLHIRFSPREHKALRKIADREDLTISYIVRRAVKRAVEAQLPAPENK